MELCLKYSDIFRLEGEKLTYTLAAKHYIPTPNIPQGRAITLKNYRIPEAQKEEKKTETNKLINDEIIRPNQSEWNFPHFNGS